MGNKNSVNSLSIVMLVYNEAEAIEDVVKEFYEKVVTKIPDTKFIVSEDGSTDGTNEILSRLNRKIPFILISGGERKGYAKAFRDALHTVDTELIFFSDSDGQHDPADIFRLLEKIDDNDIVSGYKSPRHDPVYRVFITKIYNFLFYLLFGLKIKDINSGFKLIKKAAIDGVLGSVLTMKYCVMSEFILRACLSGYKITEVPVSHYSRQYGKTSIFRLRKLPFIVARVIKDLLEIRIGLSKH